jgi:hypothetical protein
MSDEIFISYSRKDQEFVTRLASDLDEKVSGVWFDQSDIQAGEKWRDQIAQGIHRCKVFVLALSPDAANSKYVREEINLALEQNKRIIPILYRPVKMSGALADLVNETQYIDLQRGSYADNFQKLVDALVAAGAARQTLTNMPRPFLRQPVKTDWSAVFGRTFGWASAWGIGWAVFWFLIFITLLAVGSQPPRSVYALVMPIGGGLGGAIGGLLAGLISMLALRRYAPSIAWRHMSPAIRIWVLSGVLGAIISGVVGLGTIEGTMRSIGGGLMDCSGTSFGDCLGKIFVGGIVSGVVALLVAVLVIIVVVLVIWFFAGLFAGWLAVRHIRRLEPGITRAESAWTILGWGLGALVGTVASLAIISAIAGMLGSS